jgi:hypothetical protein
MYIDPDSIFSSQNCPVFSYFSIGIVQFRFEKFSGYLRALNVIYPYFLIRTDLVGFFGLLDWTSKTGIRTNVEIYIKHLLGLNTLSDSNNSIPIRLNQIDKNRFESQNFDLRLFPIFNVSRKNVRIQISFVIGNTQLFL